MEHAPHIEPAKEKTAREALEGLPDQQTHFLRLIRLEQAREVVEPVLVKGKADERDTLLALLASGDAPVDLVVRNPMFLEDLFEISESHDPLLPSPSDNTTLARFKHLSWLRIVLKERLGFADFASTATDFARLADEVSRSALRDVLGEEEPPLMMAMGKWGGRELNAASDIDPVFFAPAGLTGPQGDRLVRSWISRIVEHRPDPLYPVDLRLRPEGAGGPLLFPLSEVERYFFQRSAPWERIAYLRARAIAGEMPKWFQELLDAFLFGTKMDPKRRIEEVAEALISVHGTARTRDVKRGPGGIRDVEFHIAAIQLTEGRTHKELRRGTILDLIHKAGELGLHTDRECKILSQGYLFARRIEHVLQVEEGRARFVAPPAGTSAHLRLSYALGLTPDEFEKVWSEHRAAVSKLVSKYLPMDSDLHLIAAGITDPQREENEGSLSSLDVDDPQAISALRRLARGQGGVAGLFDPAVLAGHPDRSDALLRLESAITSFGGAEPWRSVFGRNPDALREITRLMLFGPRLVEETHDHPSLWEKLGLKEWKFDVEGISDQKHLNKRLGSYLFHLGERFLVNDLDASGLTSRWSNAVDRTVQEFAGERLNSLPRPTALLALGKWGGGELAPDADLDLMLVCEDGSAEEVAETVKLGTQLMNDLALGGRLQPDARLRPEGSGSPMVSTVSRMRDYLTSRAQPWEKMALTRARFVAGSDSIGNETFETLQAFSTAKPENPDVWEQVDYARHKAAEQTRSLSGRIPIKKALGGMMDFEFAATMAGWRLGIEPGEWWHHPIGSRLLSLAEKNGDDRWHSASEAYLELRRWEILLIITKIGKRGSLPLENDEDAPRFAIASSQSIDELRKRWAEISSLGRSIYLEVLK